VTIIVAGIGGGAIMFVGAAMGLPYDWRIATITTLAYALGRVVVPLFDRPEVKP
jgi:hypothetical protein